LFLIVLKFRAKNEPRVLIKLFL